MILGREKEKVIELDRKGVNTRKRNENLVIYGTSGMGKTSLIQRELCDLINNKCNIIVFSNKTEEYSIFKDNISLYPVSIIGVNGNVRGDIFNQDREENLYVYVDCLDSLTTSQIMEVMHMFTLSRKYNLVMTASCWDFKDVKDFGSLLANSTYHIVLPYEKDELYHYVKVPMFCDAKTIDRLNLFTEEEQNFITIKHNQDKDTKELNDKLIFREFETFDKVNEHFISNVFHK